MSNTTPPVDCPFCRSNNLLKGPIVAQTESAYLIENVTFTGNFLIIPDYHAVSPADLRDDWWQDVKNLLARIPAPLENYNLSFNIGREAGQTVKHLHLWVIPRKPDEPASRKGMSTLIQFRNEHEA